MPKPRKKDQGYDNALGSVFDFIFANNKSKSRPLRRRPTGINNTDEFSRALTELALNPALYANDALINSINDTFLGEVKLAEFKLDQDTEREKKYRSSDKNASRFRIRASDIGKAFSDPNKFADKVLQSAKADRKLTKLTGGAAMLDAALAVGIGLKAGMSTADAMAFSKTASMSYDESAKMNHKALLASNAAIKANMDLAKEVARSEGLTPDSAAYAQRVEQLVKAGREDIKKDQRELQRALQRSSEEFVGGYNLSDLVKKDLVEAQEKFRKQNRGLSDDDMRRGLRDVKDQVYKRYEDQYQERYQRSRDKIKQDLVSRYGNSPAATQRVDALLRQFDQNVERSGKYGKGISGYRLTYAENQALHASITDSDTERAKYIGAANLALAWERMKGEGEFAGETIGKGVEKLEKEVSSLSGKIKDLEDLPTRTPQQEAQLNELKNYQQKLDAHRTRLSALYANEQNRINKSGDYWRDPAIGWARPNDTKYSKAGAEELVKTEITKLEHDLAGESDSYERSRIEAEISRLGMIGNQLGMIPRSEFRNRVDSWLVSGRSFRDQILRGGIGGGLISGDAFRADRSGVFAPGMGVGVKQFMTHKVNGVEKKAFYETEIVLGRDDINPHLGRLSSLYYLTPGSLIKTALWNQEGFDFLGESRKRMIQRGFARDRRGHLASFIQANPASFSALGAELFNADGSVNMNVVAANYRSVIGILKDNQASLPAPLQSILKKADWNMRISDRFFKFGKMKRTDQDGNIIYMSFGQHYGKWMSDKMTKLRGKVSRPLEKFLKGLSSSQIWHETVGHFISGAIGLRQLINTGLKMGIKAVLTALNVVPGGTLVAIIAWLGTEAIFKLAKPAIAILMVAVWGVCALLGMGMFWLEGLAEEETIAHANMTPLGVEIYDGPSLNPDNGGGGGNAPPISALPPVASICPISPGATCNQGPEGPFSHAKMGTYAIDLSPNAGVFVAPNNGEIVESSASKDCEWDAGDQSRGGELVFRDVNGNEYTLLHVDPLVSTGPVTQGTPIARASTGLPRSSCWTGAHYHLETKSAGGYVNSLDWYNALGCSISGC